MSDPSTLPKVPLTQAEKDDRAGTGDGAVTGGPRMERRALAWLAAAAVLVIVWITKPVGLGVLLGALTAFSLEPLYKRLVTSVRRPRLVALGLLVGTALVITGALAALVWLFVNKGMMFGTKLVSAFSAQGSGTAFVDQATGRLASVGVNHDAIVERLRSAAADATAHAAVAAGAIASITGEVLMTLFFLILTAHLILRRWSEVLTRAQAALPLRPDYTLALFEEFRKVGRATLQGTLVTGIAQGVLAGIGFAIVGLSDAAFFGAATAVASLIPAIGTLLVWVPAGIFLIATGHLAGGVFTLVWGFLMVVGLSDYVIRPRLVGGDEKTPELFTFAALLGGVEVFGLQGLIVGPLLMSLALAVLRIYEREARATRRHAIEGDRRAAG